MPSRIFLRRKLKVGGLIVVYIWYLIPFLGFQKFYYLIIPIFELRRASKFPFSPCCTLTLYYSRTRTNIKYRLISEININTTRTIANLIIKRESLLPIQVLRPSGTLVCQFTSCIYFRLIFFVKLVG